VAESGSGGPERAIRWTTTLSVIVLALIAAIVSYKHVYLLVRRYGETSWTAALLPVSVDGMIVASSMSLLLDSRHGRRSGLLPWALLIIGSAASLAANVAVAEPSVVGRLIAGWPSCALIGAYELLMRQVRNAAVWACKAENTSSSAAHTTSGTVHTDSEVAHTVPVAMTPAYRSLTNPAVLPETSKGFRMSGTADLIGCSDGVRRDAADGAQPPRRDRRGDEGIQQQAWQWAMANRMPKGDLPPGKVIANEFGRSERWGRLIKQAGITGRLPRPTP
jgi:hypothetical protein